MKKLFIVLTIVWMALIFAMSARDADTSTEDSYRIGMAIGHFVIADFDEWSEEAQVAFAAKIDHPVRKTAHATEYAVLGMLLMGVFWGDGVWQACVRRAWLVAVLYAATDEFHQLFVPGRAGKVTDVCIDAAGAFAGIVCVLCLMKLLRLCGLRR